MARNERTDQCAAPLAAGLIRAGPAHHGPISIDFFLKQNELTDDDRRQVVGLHERRPPAANPVAELLVSVNRLALANDFFLNALVLGDVADRADKPVGAALGIKKSTRQQPKPLQECMARSSYWNLGRCLAKRPSK